VIVVVSWAAAAFAFRVSLGSDDEAVEVAPSDLEAETNRKPTLDATQFPSKLQMTPL